MRRFMWSVLPALVFAGLGIIGYSIGQHPVGTPAAADAAAARSPFVWGPSEVDAGRYIMILGGCNDCHTPGWDKSGGNMPESDWLTGSNVGYRGPWGVSYASNLRYYFNRLTEDQWMQIAHRGQGRPPMPWLNLSKMSDQDLKSIYAFIRSLGDKGERTPAPLPPGRECRTPYVNLMPVTPGGGGPGGDMN